MTSLNFQQAEQILSSLLARGVEFRVRDGGIEVRGQVGPQEARSLLDQKLAVMVLVMFDGNLVQKPPTTMGAGKATVRTGQSARVNKCRELRSKS